MQKRDGSILPLALIMTVTILIAGFGISTVVLQGVKRAKGTDESVGAYYMADSGVERQLFEIRKNSESLDFVASMTSTTPPTYPGGQSWVSTAGLEPSITSKTFPFVATSSFAVLDLFDPDRLTTLPGIVRVNLAWSTTAACPTARVEASYASWDLTGVPTWPSDNQYTIMPKSTAGFDVTPLDPNKAYRLRIRAYDCPIQNLIVTTYGSGGGVTAFPGDITLSAEGTYGKTTQKIAVTMPKQDVLSGLFGYVLFSECTLYKGDGSAPVCPP